MKQIFINLPVQDIEKSMKLYLQLGFTIKPLFTDDNQKCMVWSDQIYIMLQSEKMFRSYLKKEIPNPKKYQAASYTLPVESFDRVNEIVERGLKAGAIESIPMIDEGFMQVRTIEDFDGHTWGIIYLDLNKFPKQE
jgi:predicted lactoylglutathione lyase